MQIKTRYLTDPAALDRILDETFARLGFPGATAAVLHEGEILRTRAFGVRDTEGHPVTEETRFESASLTKTLFGALVLRLADEGMLDLDTPISAVYPHEPWSEDPRYGRITPRHCLSHGSGLPNWQEKPMELRFAPGTNFSYSGEGYFLLQRTVEYLTGKDLNHLLHDYFLRPLGMTLSTATWTPAVGRAFAVGFGKDGEVVKVRNARRVTGNAPEPNAAWSLCSNAFDMAKFQRFLLREHGGLSPEHFRQMHTVQNRAAPTVGWGLGWGLADADPGVLWHWGDNSGFQSLSLLDWQTGDGLCFYTNSDRGFCRWSGLVAELTNVTYGEAVEEFVRRSEA